MVSVPSADYMRFEVLTHNRYTFSDLGNTMKHSMKHSRNMTQKRSEAEQISSAGDQKMEQNFVTGTDQTQTLSLLT